MKNRTEFNSKKQPELGHSNNNNKCKTFLEIQLRMNNNNAETYLILFVLYASTIPLI